MMRGHQPFFEMRLGGVFLRFLGSRRKLMGFFFL